jgi:TolB protein
MRRSFVYVACLLGIATVGSLAPLSNGQSVQRAQERIVFVSDSRGKDELYSINPDGTGRRRLTTAVQTTSGASFDAQPGWSPTHARVVFSTNRRSRTASNNDIYVVNADGTGLHALVASARDEVDPSWSPDGRWVAYSRDSTGHGHYDLYAIRVATGQIRRLTYAQGIEATPAWSPDGRTIAYAHDGQIWVMHADGTDPRPLGKVGVGVDWAPDWSPDSKRIAFESNSKTGSRPTSDLWTMAADGSHKRCLTNNRVDDSQAAWSADGSSIVFCRSSQIWKLRLEVGKGVRLTNGWAPDW